MPKYSRTAFFSHWLTTQPACGVFSATRAVPRVEHPDRGLDGLAQFGRRPVQVEFGTALEGCLDDRLHVPLVPWQSSLAVASAAASGWLVEGGDQRLLEILAEFRDERLPTPVGDIEHVLRALPERHDLGGVDGDALVAQHLADLGQEPRAVARDESP